MFPYKTNPYYNIQRLGVKFVHKKGFSTKLMTKAKLSFMKKQSSFQGKYFRSFLFLRLIN